MSFNTNKFWGVVAIGAGVLVINYVFETFKKVDKMCKKLNTSINEMADETKIDIPERILNSAVEKAVENEVGRSVKRAAEEAVCGVKNDIHSEVKTSVNAAYSDIKDAVAKEVARQVGAISISDIKEEVIERAKETALEKFEGSLDDILEKFNGDLDNVNKIYGSIAKAITGRATGETFLRIS